MPSIGGTLTRKKRTAQTKVRSLRTNHAHVVSFVDKVLEPMKYATACGGYAPVNTSLVNWLASYASVGVDVKVADCLSVGISNPRHLAFTGAHVWSGYIYARSCGVLLLYTQFLPLKQ